MHHDFAAGGIIAFAGGGEADPGAYPEQTTLEQERAERLKNQETYGFGGDPYAEAKRRYSDLEKRQQEREQSAGSDRFLAGLSALGASGTKYFGEAAAGAAQKMQDMKTAQEATKDANAMKMAELHTLWAKEQDALNRANYAADKGRMDEKRKALMEAANYRLEREKVEATKTSAGASVTSAAASARSAETQASKEAFDQKNYPQEFALKQQEARARIANALQKPAEIQVLDRMYAEAKAKNPAATYADTFEQYKAAGMGVSKTGTLTYKDALKQASENPMIAMKGGDALIQEAKRLMAGQSGGGRKPSEMSNEELLKALGR
jgi:hypothetical protein